MIRTFIAIDLSPEIKNSLDLLIRQLNTKGSFPVKWTAVKNIHITLKFLGNVEEKLLPELNIRLVTTVKEFYPFDIRIGELGAFPNADRPRIIWVGCDLSEEGTKVQKSVEEAAASLGFPKEDRPFSPHLTIGRVTDSASPRDYPLLARLIRENPVGSLGTQPIGSIRVYRSDLLPGGPKYQVLCDIPFGASKRV